MTPICKQLGIPKFHDIPKIQNEPHVAGSNVMHQVHEAHNLCLDLVLRMKNINSINYFSSQVRSIILVATESLLYYRLLHIIIANVIMLFIDIVLVYIESLLLWLWTE